MKKIRVFDDKAPADEKIADYRWVFLGSDAGVRVLTDLLISLGHYHEAENDDDRVLSNFAKKLLRNIGTWEASNLENITRAYAAVEQYHDVYLDEGENDGKIV